MTRRFVDPMPELDRWSLGNDPLTPADGKCATELEAFARMVRDALPLAEVTRTRDCIQIDWGDEAGIVVLVTPEAMELRLPTVEWACGSYGPRATSKLWRRVEWQRLDPSKLPELLKAAKTARKRQYRTCQYCGERFPPEHRADRDTCHGCASREHGVVY